MSLLAEEIFPGGQYRSLMLQINSNKDDFTDAASSFMLNLYSLVFSSISCSSVVSKSTSKVAIPEFLYLAFEVAAIIMMVMKPR